MKSILWSGWVLMAVLLPGEALAQAKAKAPAKSAEPRLVWQAVGTENWEVEGRGWVGEKRLRYFDRLPAAAEGKVTSNVWSLSRDSAGMVARFETDATSLWVDYTLRSEKLALPHMPATGVSGVDLYARDERDGGRWKWVQVSRPTTQSLKVELVKGLRPGRREYALYLPLYNGIETLSVGVPEGTTLTPLKPRPAKPVVFYGTSITHGACASRPGMVHTAILGRRLDLPVINLGFSGNGRMDAEVGELLARQEAAVLVIDCLPNMQPEMVSERTVPLVKRLREAHPKTPIVLVEDRRYTNSWITPEKDAFHDRNHAALRSAYEALQKAGVKGLHYVSGEGLYGTDTEGATDASHASDLGFMRQADLFEPVLRAALGQ